MLSLCPTGNLNQLEISGFWLPGVLMFISVKTVTFSQALLPQIPVKIISFLENAQLKAHMTDCKAES